MTQLYSDEIEYDEPYKRSNYKSCNDYYRALFPNVTRRTMQRDFVTLNRIGYPIEYDRKYQYYAMWEDTGYRSVFNVRNENGRLVYTYVSSEGEYEMDYYFVQNIEESLMDIDDYDD